MSKTLRTQLQDIIGQPMPEVFGTQTLRPLKVGIFDDMVARYPALEAAALSAWFSQWTRQPVYLKRVATGRWRYDLDCEPVSEIRKCERDHAKWLLMLMAEASVSKSNFGSASHEYVYRASLLSHALGDERR
jgi:sRNA-binding protein